MVRNVQGQIVLEQRQAGGKHRIGARRKVEGVTRIRCSNLVIIDSWAAIGSNDVQAIADKTEEKILAPLEAYGIQEISMVQEPLGVHEVGTRSVGVHVEQYELEVCPVVGERLKCVPIGNS